MRTTTLKAFLLLVLFAPFLASCGDDTVGPDDVDYPVTMVAKSIESKSAIRAFVREGEVWREITSENPEVLTNEFFAEASVITEDEDPDITLKSATGWTAATFPDSTFAYTYSGDKFTFSNPFTDDKVYATGDYSTLKMHVVAGVGVTTTEDGGGQVTTLTEALRTYYPSGSDPIEGLTSSALFGLSYTEGTIIAYQTFDVVYQAQ